MKRNISQKLQEAAQKYSFINRGIDTDGEAYVDYDSKKMAGFIAGAEWADKTMIEKAVKWLSNFYQYKLGYRPFEEVVEDFKQAMEE